MSTRDNLGDDSVALILDSGYIVVRSTFTNRTLHQVENHVNKLGKIGYVFNRQNKLEVEDNRFQHYLLITDLLVGLPDCMNKLAKLLTMLFVFHCICLLFSLFF